MKKKLFIVLIVNIYSLSAMQPMQWIRNVTPQVQAELKAEDTAAATEELAKLAWQFNGPDANSEDLITQTKQLLARGANPNVQSKIEEFDTPNNYILSFAIPHSPAIVQLLLQAGADPNIESTGRLDPIIFKAIDLDRANIVELLLEYGADPNKMNVARQTPIMLAADEHHFEIVRLLLSYGANPNVFDDLGNSPLIIAVHVKNIFIIKLLLQAGADPYATQVGFTKSALSTARGLLENTTRENKRKIYQEIITMFEHPETVRHVDLQKLP